MAQTITIASTSEVFRCIRDRAPRGGSMVYDASTGRFKAVRNLGWLLSHSNEIHDLWVSTYSYRSLAVGGGLPFGRCDHPGGLPFAILAVRMETGKVYVTDYADRHLLAEWLLRGQKFRGRLIHWDHKSYIVGSTDYKKELIFP
jgi:hypothetical protein